MVEPDDTVIELGCHTGGTTRLIPESCNIIALDNSPEAEDSMRKLPHVKFINADVRLHDVLAEVFKMTQSCDILAIDLGGGYHPDTVFKVFYIWSSTFKPKHGYLESYHDSGIPPQIKEFDLWTDSLKKDE